MSTISVGKTINTAYNVVGDTTGNLIIQVDGTTEAMRIANTGYVGIGTSTPNGKLHISGNANSVFVGLNLENANTVSSAPGVKIAWTQNNEIKSSIVCNTFGGDYMAFNVSTDTERMRITNVGRVGIGTNNPSTKLHISGNSAIDSSGLKVTDVNTGGNTLSLDPANGQGLAQIDSSGANALRFNTNNVEAFRITSAQKFYFGTTSTPTTNAEGLVNAVAPTGTDAFNVKHLQNGNNFFNIWQVGTGTFSAFAFYKGDSQNIIGTVSVSTTAVAYNTTSDYRLKYNVKPLSGAISRVMLLKPVSYKWKVDDSEGEGFIAHELQEVCPLAVTGKKDDVYSNGNMKIQGVDTSKIIALLTSAVQEQQAIIEQLKSDVEALKGNK